MFILNEKFEYCSDFEGDMLISEMQIDLVKENISMQIGNPLSTRTNFLAVMEDKFNTIIDNNMVETGEETEDSFNELIDLFTFTLEKMNSVYGLNIDINDIVSDSDLVDMTMQLYSFLILRYKKNICKFLYNYIKKNRKSLIEYFDLNIKRKDVSTISLKKNIKNKDMVLLISNLSTIIKHILELDVDNDTFMEYAIDDDYYEGIAVYNMIRDDIIRDEFVSRYTNIISSDYDYVLDEIQVEVRNKIYNK